MRRNIWGHLFLLAFCASVPLSACSNTDCKTDADCGSDQLCVYPVKEGCAAKGVCEDTPNIRCASLVLYCGCDGSAVSVPCGFSGGSAPVSGRYASSCLHGGAQAGDACTTSADCAESFGCFFPIADQCSATGVCLAGSPNDPQYSCEVEPQYCECDGRSTETVCGGHDGFLPAPAAFVLAPGKTCADGDGHLSIDAGAAGSN